MRIEEVPDLLVKRYGMNRSGSVEEKVDCALQFLFDDFFYHDRQGNVIWRNGGRDARDPQGNPLGKAVDRNIENVCYIATITPLDEAMADWPGTQADEKRFLEARKSIIVAKAAFCRGVKDPDYKKLENDFYNDVFNMGIRYFGDPKELKLMEPKYSGDELLEMGLVPQSCVSFAVLAYDILKVMEIPNNAVLLRDPKKPIHAFVIYISSNGRPIKCDPKWQKFPEFFKEFPEERPRFEADPEYYVHGIYTETGENGVRRPKRYEKELATKMRTYRFE